MIRVLILLFKHRPLNQNISKDFLTSDKFHSFLKLCIPQDCLIRKQSKTKKKLTKTNKNKSKPNQTKPKPTHQKKNKPQKETQNKKKSSLCYQHCFVHKSKIQHILGCSRGNLLPDSVWSDIQTQT